MPCWSWLTSSCDRVSAKNSCFGLVALREHRASGVGVELSVRAMELRECSGIRRARWHRSRGSARLRVVSRSACEEPVRRGCSSASPRAARAGMSVPNWRDQRACMSLQARVASLAGISMPSTSAAVVFRTPLKSREWEPPQKTNVRPMAPRTTHASHFWPCRPSRIRCSIPCPENETKKIGGADGTRTRDPRRDRPVF